MPHTRRPSTIGRRPDDMTHPLESALCAMPFVSSVTGSNIASLASPPALMPLELRRHAPGTPGSHESHWHAHWQDVRGSQIAGSDCRPVPRHLP